MIFLSRGHDMITKYFAINSAIEINEWSFNNFLTDHSDAKGNVLQISFHSFLFSADVDFFCYDACTHFNYVVSVK